MNLSYFNFPQRSIALALLLALLHFTNLTGQTVTTFSHTGSAQTWTVPQCVTTITVFLQGAQGGNAAYNGANGGSIRGILNVTAGQVLNIYVGGQGSGTTGGFNGGGTAGTGNGANNGGGGGGASDIRMGGVALSNRIIVAGAGGGSGGNSSWTTTGGTGGGGSACTNSTGVGGGAGSGCATGGSGSCAGGSATSYGTGGAGGGISSGGGIAGTTSGQQGSAGGLGTGGNGGSYSGGGIYGGGGGGAGYYGGSGGSSGSGGCHGGGGGGSSWANSTLMSSVTFTGGNRSGHGLVSITSDLGVGAITTTISANTICNGGSATIAASGQNTYSWAPVGGFAGSSSSVVVVSPSVTTSFSVTGSNSLCTSEAIITVTVDQGLPSLTIANSATNSSGICPGTTATLTASGATTYSWTGSVVNSQSFAPTSTSGYTVTGGNACGTSSAATSISIHPLPAITLSSSQASVCTSQSIALCPNGGTSYTISHSAPICAPHYPFNTSTYTVTGTSALGCTNTAMTTVSVVPTPAIPPLSTHSLVCIGNSATITAMGATNYSWEPQTSTASSIIVTPTVTTTYTLVKWNANCYDTQMVTVIVNQLPTIFAIVNPTIVCASRPATLSAGGGVDYTWTDGNTTIASGPNAANVTVFPTQNTTYTVTGSDGTCTNTTSIALATHTNPIISVAPSSSVICAGETVTLNVSGAEVYGFNNNPSTSPPLTGTSTVLQLTTTTNYMVTGTNVSTGCWSGSQQVILVHPLPLINISASPVLVCKGFPSSLNATSLPQSPAHTYTWTHGGTGNSSVVNPEVTSVYTVTGTNNTTGCLNTQTASVAVFLPDFSTTSDTAICIKGSITLIAGGALSYTWTGLQSQSPYVTVTPGAKTIYTVSATSQTVNGLKCVSSKTIEVDIYPKPTVVASSEKSVVCRNHSTELYATGANTYTWITVNQLGDTITVTPLMEMTYSVVGADVFGCRDTSGVVVLFSNCPGFAENALDKVSIGVYPNPNEGTFVIEAFADMKLNLVNELGQIVREITLSQYNNRSANVKDLAAGIYFITGQHENKLINQKVIIK